MSQSGKNEVDLLLRALGREARAKGSDSPFSERLGAHLEADELNAFAENVLPAATRARYAAHLADCDDCRGIVSQLAQSAGVIQRQFPESTQPTFWNYVSAFFSPAVLRYAIPALVLVLVAGIGLFVYREQQRPDLVAQRTNVEVQPSNVAEPVPVAPVESVNRQESGTSANVASDKSSSTSAPATKSEQTGKGVSSAEPATGRVEESVTVERHDKAAADAPPPQVTYAPEPKSDAPVPSRDEQVGQTAAAREREQKAGRDVEAQRAEADSTKDVNARSISTLPMTGRASGPQKKEAGLAKDKNAQADVRSVAGRQFRRDGDTWIDTAYDGRATVVVKRGSEQYRALVADEPQLRSIAESFSGTVIVVWKGRGYRFH